MHPRKSFVVALALSVFCLSVSSPVVLAGGQKKALQERRSGTNATSNSEEIVTRNCDNLNKRRIKTITPDDELTNPTTSFVDILDARVSFQTSARTCVIFTFSARALAPDTTMSVRPLLDNVLVGFPFNGYDFAFASQDNLGLTTPRSFTWLYPDVGPGLHNIKVQFKSDSAGKTVYVFQQTLDVSYR